MRGAAKPSKTPLTYSRRWSVHGEPSTWMSPSWTVKASERAAMLLRTLSSVASCDEEYPVSPMAPIWKGTAGAGGGVVVVLAGEGGGGGGARAPPRGRPARDP